MAITSRQVSTIALATLTFFSSLAPAVGASRKKTSALGATCYRACLQPTVRNGKGSVEQAGKILARMPLMFEANQGQADSRAKYVARGAGFGLLLTAQEAVMTLKQGPRPTQTARKKDGAVSTVHMKLAGSNQNATISPLGELPTRMNYFIGSNPAAWHADIPTYSKVLYQEVYPGVDVVYYGNAGQLEYDFLVAPLADPNQIRIEFRGCDSLEIDAGGDLVLRTAAGEVRHHKPLTYQQEGELRREIPSAYHIGDNNVVSFRVGAYDRTRPLVIDPVLAYSTYLGGSSNDFGKDMFVDAAGNTYVVGDSVSANFLSTASPTNSDVFVTRLAPNGLSVNYSFFGGSGNDFATSIAVDQAGNVYFGGVTESADFPRVAALDTTLGGTRDAFITKLSISGNNFVYSTLLGGSGDEAGVSIAIDGVTSAYVTGRTSSAVDFPRFNALQPDYGGGVSDAFVTKLTPDGAAYAYSTFLGGSGTENTLSESGIAVDAAGNAYVTGDTLSTNFPLRNALQQNKGGNAATTDAFVSKINPTGSDYVYSTYLGGTLADTGLDIAADAVGNAYVTGASRSTAFPGATPLRTAAGEFDAFVAKLNAAGSAYSYFTFLGGTEDDFGNAIALDSTGNVYLAGSAGQNFVTVQPVQSAFTSGGEDAFATRLNTSGAITFSTYLGGGNSDQALGVGVDSAGNIYLSGFTGSTDFRTAVPIEDDNAGAIDLFVAKIDPNTTPSNSTDPVVSGASIQGKKLNVTGHNFDIGAEVFLNGEKQKKVVNGSPDPTILLVAKKSGKKIAPGQTVLLRVRNTDGRISNSFFFTLQN